MRFAIWSGPRNLSTAMMYSFGARSDFTVMDEPFYAPYLKATGLDHPMAQEIIDQHESDPAKVARMCQQDGTPHVYMKHMPHHMVPGFPMDWAEGCVHVHLIRHPARVIASYAAKREAPTLDDIGFVQQAKIMARVEKPIVVDASDIRFDPAAMLQRLCAALGIAWTEKMLSWPAGGHASDGVWAAHWYGAVHRSTGFAGPDGPLPEVTGPLAELVEVAMPYYEAMATLKLTRVDDPAPPAISDAKHSAE